ncbi:class I SAM-dependent methyltransferase [Halobaculum sp. MBLA0143]|uniref:class I SAM-dependent methyltransferase n=1 Tax=Halobaculum sp. MBLA0143 TaxID=3079933 RepID=UPI003523741A
MGYHTFDVGRADALEDDDRFRFCSAEELRSALALTGTETVADLGSGTGFYTDTVADRVDHCYAVDVQSAMHDHYREKGLPETVEPVTAEVADLPFPDDTLDAAFSTMTFHEFASEAALAELARVVAPGGRVVTVDWSRHGAGEAGPPRDERFGAGEAATFQSDAGLRLRTATERDETFLTVADGGPA